MLVAITLEFESVFLRKDQWATLRTGESITVVITEA
jgi:hypothetical protein